MVPAVSHRISPVPRYSGYWLNQLDRFHVKGFHLLRPTFPGSSIIRNWYMSSVLQPQICRNIFGLGCSAFAHHYLRNHYCFLLLWVLRCFSSPRSPPITGISRSAPGWVAPFGHLRIKGYLHLPEAFRSLSRPSSPLRAKASTIRSYLFSLVFFVLDFV